MFSAQRLIIARKRRRKTGRELAEAMNVDPVYVTRWEQQYHMPDDRYIDAMASVLCFPRSFFFASDLDTPTADAVSFRSLTDMTARERDAALAAGALAYLLSDWVDERFNLPTSQLVDLSNDITPSMAAVYIRRQWGLGEAPIGNIIHLMESKGVRVFSLAENTKHVDAFSCWRDGVPYVFLNTFKTSERSRFDAAHELGHLLLHKHGGPNQGKRAEAEANEFASAFLMPENDVKAHVFHVSDLDSLIPMKRRWGVALSALVYRLGKIGRITSWQNRGFNIEINRRGFRENEPNGMDRETSAVWKQVFGSLWQDRITKATVAAQLHIPEDELENLVFGLNINPAAPAIDARKLSVI